MTRCPPEQLKVAEVTLLPASIHERHNAAHAFPVTAEVTLLSELIALTLPDTERSRELHEVRGFS